MLSSREYLGLKNRNKSESLRAAGRASFQPQHRVGEGPRAVVLQNEPQKEEQRVDVLFA